MAVVGSRCGSGIFVVVEKNITSIIICRLLLIIIVIIRRCGEPREGRHFLKDFFFLNFVHKQTRNQKTLASFEKKKMFCFLIRLQIEQMKKTKHFLVFFLHRKV